MEALSVRDYRNNLSKSFNRVDNGEQVLIRRGNAVYALICVERDENLTKNICNGLEQVKQIKNGELARKTLENLIDEL